MNSPVKVFIIAGATTQRRASRGIARTRFLLRHDSGVSRNLDALDGNLQVTVGTMTRASKFWDRIAERYAQQPIADEASYQTKLEITRGHLRPDMCVLEFGCGTGSTAIAHAPYVAHIRAIDISARMIAIARCKADAAGIANIDFEQADIGNLDAADGAFDAVLGLSILHLVDDRTAVLARVHRVLRPGGVFVSSTACLGDGMAWFRPIAAIAGWLGFLPTIKFFGRTDLESAIAAAGFEIAQSWQPGKGKAVFIVATKPAPRPGAKAHSSPRD